MLIIEDNVGILERLVGFITNPSYAKSYEVALDALATMLHERSALERVSHVPEGGTQADSHIFKILQLLKQDVQSVKVKR